MARMAKYSTSFALVSSAHRLQYNDFPSTTPTLMTELFIDAADKTAEAKSKFVELPECTYSQRQLGSTGLKERMSCDCEEQWDDETETNLACGEHLNCINRVTSVECVNNLCLCGRNCQNQRFQKRQYASVKVVATEMKGYGLVTETDLSEGLFIYEYIGEVVDEPAFRKRMVEYDQRRLKHFYFMMLTKNAFIDATVKGSLARFCNHLCAPNAFVDKWVVGDKLRMGIFARRDIKRGEEITFDYNVDRYGAQLQKCYCGAPNCLGWMGGKTQTDAALLLPDGLLEALGVTRAEERTWLKTHKKLENHDEFVAQLSVQPLDEVDVNKVMGALMKAESSVVAGKLVERLYLTDDQKTNASIVKLHGYKTLSQVLKEYGTADDDLTVQVLLILKKWPLMTRNKIELLQIEDVVKHIVEELGSRRVHDLALELLAEWSKLEMAYRIPKHEPQLPTDHGPASPGFSRNARSELPLKLYTVEEDELPDGWQKAFDPNSNMAYYYHAELGILRWDRPEGSVPEEPKPKKQLKPKNGRPKLRDVSSIEEERLRKLKEDQFNEVRNKEKLLHELIIQLQREAEEKKRAAEQLRQEKFERIRDRKKKQSKPAVSPEALWTKAFAKYVPNMIKKHEAEIGHDNIKGCAKDLVHILAAKEVKKDATLTPPAELDSHKLKKIKDFSNGFMDKFLVKYRNKKAKHQ